MGVVRLSISPLHPAFAGHFPGTPIVPGVVLLDETLRALTTPAADGAFGCEISAAKFHSVVQPGEALTLEHEPGPNGSIRFVIRAPERLVASGRLTFAGSARSTSREA
jgi:3-hydroxymyristoyl/3-hydroxydecanoyl-(acyl carrier protein) dehydratase